MQPTVEISTEDGFAWVIVWWRPVTTSIRMLRPDAWHTTVLRFTVPPEYSPATQALAKAEYQAGLDALLAILSPIDELDLARAPWKRSWNFGLAADSKRLAFAAAVEACAVMLQKKYYVGAEVAERRELHISWH